MLILDVGALYALERHDRVMWRRLKASHQAGELPLTHGGVIAAAWRGDVRTPVVLIRALNSVDVIPFDDVLGRAAGRLLAAARVGDVMTAGLTLLARHGDQIVTSEPNVIAKLAAVANLRVDVVSID